MKIPKKEKKLLEEHSSKSFRDAIKLLNEANNKYLLMELQKDGNVIVSSKIDAKIIIKAFFILAKENKAMADELSKQMLQR